MFIFRMLTPSAACYTCEKNLNIVIKKQSVEENIILLISKLYKGLILNMRKKTIAMMVFRLWQMIRIMEAAALAID